MNVLTAPAGRRGSATALAPSLFISHGSPMFAVLPGALGPRLRSLGASLEGIRAVLVVSPHWQTRDMRVMTTPKPATIHDFGGFPEALYQLQYTPDGAPALADEAARLLTEAGFDITLDAARGLDHGAWVPLLHLLPDANVPVFQVSMPFDLGTVGALRLGQALAPLRAQGVLVIGSGSLTHNLYEVRRDVRDPEYAVEFAHWAHAAVRANDIEALVDYRRRAPHAARAHPTEEHYLPLVVALGAAQAGDLPQLIYGGITDGILSMDSFAWGLPDSAETHRLGAA
ncbi:MAG: class III extradiol ring-cleavage dioxygenase [Pseudomonadota bacterium]|nr:class III extradiol ring-cleavage dioxygenase [Pseudomonadota bacterium]